MQELFGILIIKPTSNNYDQSILKSPRTQRIIGELLETCNVANSDVELAMNQLKK